MTVIVDNVDWWIEYFHVARASLSAASRRNTNFTLSKAGNFMGGSITTDADLAGGFIQGVQCALVQTNNAELLFGQQLSAIRSIMSNGTGSALICGEHVLVYLRK